VSLIELVKERASAYKTDHMMLLYGDDFLFDDLEFGRSLLEKMERVVQYINNNSKLTARLATPSEYFEAVRKTKVKLHSYKGDFLPLMNTKNSHYNFYWTGFYSSKPQLKRKIAEAHDLVRTAKMLSALVLREDFDTKDADFGLHHDAITGTNRVQVAASYTDLMNSAIKQAEVKISEAFEQLSKPDTKQIAKEYRPLVVFNPVNWTRQQLVHFETSSLHVKVLDSALSPVPAQVVQTPQGAVLVLFYSSLEGLSFKTYFVIQYDSPCEDCASLSKEATSLQMGSIRVDLDNTCNVSQIVQDREHFEVKTRFYKYLSYRGGTYTFNPYEGDYVTDIELLTCKLYQGELAAVAFAEWRRSSSVLKEPYRQRLIVGQDSLKWQLEVSPTLGEELFLRLEGAFYKTKPKFHTFSSGDLRQRVYRANSDIRHAGMNYYPIPGALVVGELTAALTFVPEFPTGAGLPAAEDSLDIHLHRNMKQDDNFGLGQKLNDSSVTVHTFHVSLGRVTHRGLWHKYLTAKHSFQLFSVTDLKPLKLSTSALQAAASMHQPWGYATQGVGLTSEDVYLSSASWKTDRVVVRLLEMAESDVQVDWQNLTLFGECNLGGFDLAKEVATLAGQEVLVNSQRKKSGYSVALRAQQPKVLVNGLELTGLQAYTADYKAHQTSEDDSDISQDHIFIRTNAYLGTVDLDDTSAESQTEANQGSLSLQETYEVPKSLGDEVYTEETLVMHLVNEGLPATTHYLEALEYAVVAGLSVVALVSMLVYFRCTKRRRD
jgi:hypothetical protein